MNGLQHRTDDTQNATPVYMLHGVFAVQDAERGYTVVEVQQGVITATTADTITVTSPDGYIRTYSLGDYRPSSLVALGPGSRVTAMLTADGILQLAEVGEPPVDGSRLSALIPVVPLPR